MSNFVRANPLSWGPKSIVRSAELNALDIDHAKAINGDDGSTHAPGSPIELLGAHGLLLNCKVGGTWDSAVAIATGTFAIGDGTDVATLVVAEDSTLELQGGATLETQSGSGTNLRGNTHLFGAGVDANGGAGHHVVSGGKLYVDASGEIVVRQSGEVTVRGTFTSAALSSMVLAGFTQQTAGSFTLAPGVAMTLHGGVTIKSDGTFTTELGSTSTFAGATVHNADVDLNATTTFTGPIVPSGAGARIYKRATTGGLSDLGGVHDVTPTHDIYIFTPSGDRVYRIADGTEGQVVRFAIYGEIAAGTTVTFKRSDDSVIGMIDQAKAPGLSSRGLFIEMVWTGPGWFCCGGYCVTA